MHAGRGWGEFLQRSASFIPSWAVLYKTVCCVGGDLLHEPIRVDIWIVIVARTAFDILSEVQSRRHDDAITFFLVVQGRVKFLVLVPIVSHVLRSGVRAWFEGWPQRRRRQGWCSMSSFFASVFCLSL